MEQSVFKVFFSKKKETEWLNNMGHSGFYLSYINDSKYVFDVREGHFYGYSIEYLNCSPESDDAISYYKQYEAQGVYPVVSSGNWVYFVSEDKPIVVTPESYKKNSLFYFWRVFYLLFFSLCGAIVCGYQAFSVGYLERIGQHGNGQIREVLNITGNNAILDTLKKLGNFLIDFVNRYFKLWTNIFGESDAVAVISIVAPITLALLIIAGFNLNEYFIYRSLSKVSLPQNKHYTEEGVINAEQRI